MSNSDSAVPRSDPGSLPTFAVGTSVRVRRGVPDPDYPDFPLGGWAGVVREINDQGEPCLYLVEWTADTQRHAHPVHRFRCDRDDLDCESTWLAGADLEADPGGPLDLEKP